MYDDATAEDTCVESESLWVVITVQRRSFCFELDGQRRHSISIGSAPCADIRIEQIQPVPIECNLMREAGEIWIIPGWPTNFIRVDSVVVDRPMRLWRRCGVQIEGVHFEVRIREEPPTSPDCGGPFTKLSPPPSFDATLGAEPVSVFVQNSAVSYCMEPYDSVPSSTAPTTRPSVELGRDSKGILELLGLLTKRRPWLVALGASLGAGVLAIGMHTGLRLVRTVNLASSSEAAVPLLHIRECTPNCFEEGDCRIGKSMSFGCDRVGHWLLSNWPTPKPVLNSGTVTTSSSLQHASDSYASEAANQPDGSPRVELVR